VESSDTRKQTWEVGDALAVIIKRAATRIEPTKRSNGKRHELSHPSKNPLAIGKRVLEIAMLRFKLLLIPRALSRFHVTASRRGSC